MYRALVNALFQGIIRYYTTLTIEGESNVPKGGCIICANHLSHSDSLFLMLATRQTSDTMAFVAAYDYWFKHKIRRALFTSALTLIPIDRRPKEKREIPFKVTITRCREFLDEKKDGKIVFYGTGSRDKGAFQVKPGIVLLSASLGIPIVPIQLKNTDVFFGKNKRWFQKTPVKATIMRPIVPNITFDSKQNQFCPDQVSAIVKKIENSLASSTVVCGKKRS